MYHLKKFCQKCIISMKKVKIGAAAGAADPFFFRFFLAFDHFFPGREVGDLFFFFFFDFFKPKFLEQLQNFSQEYKLFSKFNLKIFQTFSNLNLKNFKNILENFSKLVVLKNFFEIFTCKNVLGCLEPKLYFVLNFDTPNCFFLTTDLQNIFVGVLDQNIFDVGACSVICLDAVIDADFFVQMFCQSDLIIL